MYCLTSLAGNRLFFQPSYIWEKLIFICHFTIKQFE
jgi:hypothetical protein